MSILVASDADPTKKVRVRPDPVPQQVLEPGLYVLPPPLFSHYSYCTRNWSGFGSGFVSGFGPQGWVQGWVRIRARVRAQARVENSS
jgi:hypothetical protein